MTIFILVISISVITIKKLVNKSVENKKKIYLNELQQNEKDYKSVTLTFAGDAVYHMDIINSAYNNATGEYDFTSNFKTIKHLFEGSDINVITYDGTMVPDLYPISAYPKFNGPFEICNAFNYLGINLVNLGTNHSLDYGREGLLKTIDAFNERGLSTIGTSKREKDRIRYFKVKGIKFAFISYSEFLNNNEKEIPENEPFLVVKPSKEIIEKELKEAKEKSDFIVVLMHWGTEYMEDLTINEKDFSEILFENGADLVIGSHPHVLQKAKVVSGYGDDKFICYSLGNFISNQRIETLDNFNTEFGAVARFKVSINDDKAVLKEASYVPIWVNSYKDKNQNQRYEVIDTINYSNKKDKLSNETIDRIDRAREKALEILEGD